MTETTDVRVMTAPAVYLVGKQILNQAELDRFLADSGVEWESDSQVAAEVITETAGRICYLSYQRPRPGGNEAYIGHIKESKHGSVAEHAVWTFIITGVSRSLSHELVRHRAGWAFSQLSQRFVDESVAEYVEPDIVARDPELHAIWLDAVSGAHAAYVRLAERLNAKLTDSKRTCDLRKGDGDGPAGYECPACGGSGEYFSPSMMLPPDADKTTIRKTARQAARSVLPNATETKLTVTLNARSARHFFEQRGSRHADPEIRRLANAMYLILLADAPNWFSDYTRTPLPDGTFELDTKYRKI